MQKKQKTGQQVSGLRGLDFSSLCHLMVVDPPVRLQHPWMVHDSNSSPLLDSIRENMESVALSSVSLFIGN